MSNYSDEEMVDVEPEEEKKQRRRSGVRQAELEELLRYTVRTDTALRSQLETRRRSRRQSGQRGDRYSRVPSGEDSAPAPRGGDARPTQPQRPSWAWNENNRPGFYDDTRASMLEDMWDEADQEYICPGWGCAPHYVDEDEITIDHIKDWKSWILENTDTDPRNPQYISKVDAKTAYNDTQNLQGMCGNCNSRKNGPRNLY